MRYTCLRAALLGRRRGGSLSSVARRVASLGRNREGAPSFRTAVGSALHCNVMMDCCDACDETVSEGRTDAQRRTLKRDAEGRQRGEAEHRTLAQKYSHSQEVSAQREAIREKVRSCVAFGLRLCS